MSKSESPESPQQQRRLGLLQCPNAALLGWSQHASADSSSADQADVGAPAKNGNKAGRDVESPPNNKNISAKGGKRDGPTGLNDATSNAATVPSDVELSVAKPMASAPLQEDLDGNDKESQSSRKRPRFAEPLSSSSRLPQDAKQNASGNVNDEKEGAPANNDDADGATIETPLFNDAADQTVKPPSASKQAMGQSHISVSLDYETPCPWATATASNATSEEQSKVEATSSSTSSLERTQILTISHLGDNAGVCQPRSLTVIGTISGKAKLEVLPPDSDGEASSRIISLDVFGYRLPTTNGNNNTIIIDRPSWMNSLPLSVVCHGPSSSSSGQAGSLPATLKIRIHSLSGNESKSTTTDDATEGYYSAYPEDSYNVRILPPYAIKPDNYTAAGGGVSTILKPWKNAADKVVDAMQGKGAELSESAVTHNDGNDDVKSIPQSIPPGSNQNRVLLCGAKNVGKSTFLRYIINRILSEPISSVNSTTAQNEKPRRVAILDLDSGQPELSPPGMLSLTVLSRPLLSDPPMHMVCGGKSDRNDDGEGNENDHSIQHEAAYFYGDVTSKSDPDTFIQMASQLMQRYSRLNADDGNSLPLVVNTDGWVKGFGFEILSAVIGSINPGHVVQILGSTKAKSFDMSSHIVLPSECVGNDDNAPPQQQQQQHQRVVHVIQSFEGGNIIAEYDEEGNKSRRLSDSSGYAESATGTLLATASDHRTHRICAYFFGGYEEMIKLQSNATIEHEPVSFHREKGLIDNNHIIGMSLASMLPYAVPFQAVRLFSPSGLLDSTYEPSSTWGVTGDQSSSDVLDSMNGAVVGLCCNPDEIDAPLASCNAGIGTPILPCVGLGIIRSIDRVRRVFYILTPVHHKMLASVTCLVGGNIGLPIECVFRGTQSDSFPFVTCGHSLTNPGIGADKMKSRNHSGRQRN